jgi:hypothetical protein
MRKTKVAIIILLLIITASLSGCLGYNLANEKIEDPNIYTSQDAAHQVGSETNDTLMLLRMYGDKGNFQWNNISIMLSVGDNVYSCAIGETEACSISQETGDDVYSWEIGEYIWLSENNVDICSQPCQIDIRVVHYNGLVDGGRSIAVN